MSGVELGVKEIQLACARQLSLARILLRSLVKGQQISSDGKGHVVVLFFGLSYLFIIYLISPRIWEFAIPKPIIAFPLIFNCDVRGLRSL